MRSGLLSDLVSIGYEIFLEGNNIRYRYQKPGNPPDTVDPLIEELRKYKDEVLNILKMGDTITPTEKSQSRANVKAAWPLEIQALIDWFFVQDQPTEPFYLEPHRKIVAPVKFFESLRRGIEAGPAGPRGRNGALLYDLKILRKNLH
jgi:hypothetical protein